MSARISSPKISIITVVFNARDSLEKTILSVEQQNYQNIEFIVVDGQSTDGTIELIRSNENISKSIVEEDDGLFFAMNKGKALASGDFAFFMNAGDEFCTPNVIRELVDSIEDPDSNYFGNVVISNGYRTWRMGYNRLLKSENVDKRSLTIHHQGIFFPASFYRSNDYDTSFRLVAESDYISRALMATEIKFVELDILHSKMEGFGISRFKTLSGTSAYYRELKGMMSKYHCIYNRRSRSTIGFKCYAKYVLYKIGGMRLMTTVLGWRANLYSRLGWSMNI